MWIVPSFSTMPPGLAAVWRVCRFTMCTPWTMTRFSSRSTRRTSPFLPRSRPVMTTTLSPFLILSFVAMMRLPRFPLEHFGCQGDDLHELLRPQLARHGPEDAGPDRLALLVDQHGGVAVE